MQAFVDADLLGGGQVRRVCIPTETNETSRRDKWNETTT